MPAPTDSWRLEGTVLTPTTAHLQAYTLTLLNRPLPDQILTFRFPNNAALTFHKSYLTHASPALRALVTPPFMQPSTDTLHLRYESFRAFRVIRDFLYLTPIPIARLPPSVPLVADRWGLHDLFRLYLTFVQSYQWPSLDHFINACLPLMHHPRLPPQFKRSVAINLANNLHDLQSWIRDCSSHCDACPCEPPCATQRFRESVLWQALHKQRLIPRFIKYLKFFHRNNSFNYLAFLTHALYDVLGGLITEKDIAKIMTRGVSRHVPRRLSGSSRDVRVCVDVEESRISQIYNLVDLVLGELMFPSGFIGTFSVQLDVDAAIQGLLADPVKSISDGSGDDVSKSVYQIDYGD